MCYACGSQWPPFCTKVQIAPPPVKEETIFIDDNTAFYPDYRQGIHPPGPVYQGLGAAAPNMWAGGMYGTNMYPMTGMAGMAGMAGMYGGMGPYQAQTMCNYQIPGFGAQQFMYPQTGWPYTYTYSYPFYSPYTSPSYSAFNTPFSSEPPHLLCYPTVALNTYSQMSLTAAPGVMPGQFPAPVSPADLTAQAAAAAEHNKQIASMPNATPYIMGASPGGFAASVPVQAPLVGGSMAMAPGMGTMVANTQPTTLAPYKPGEPNQFWCRETDGAWSLRNYSEICLGEVSPGHWEKHIVSGYFYWVRHLA